MVFPPLKTEKESSKNLEVIERERERTEKAKDNEREEGEKKGLYRAQRKGVDPVKASEFNLFFFKI